MHAGVSPSRSLRIVRRVSSGCAPGTARSTSTRARSDVAHAYTPGLRVTDSAVVRRERRLPLRGQVLAAVGEAVQPGTPGARSELPGHVQKPDVAGPLSVRAARGPTPPPPPPVRVDAGRSRR